MRDLAKTRALVVGLGRSGEAAARFLLGEGARVAVTDDKPEAQLGGAPDSLRTLGVELHLGGHQTAVFREQDLVVVSPGVPWDLPAIEEARRHGVEVVGEVELAAAWLKGPVIGVTGANGKTTTAALIAHLLSAGGLKTQLGGNVGAPYPPATAMIAASSAHQWNVLELSSFQLESIREFRAHIAVCLNVTPDHLDRHRTFEIYAGAKGRLFETQQEGDWAVLNADDPVCVGYSRKGRATAAWFGRARQVPPGTSVCGDWIVFTREGRQIPLVERRAVPLRGAHNLENALAATAAAFLAGVAPDAMQRGMPGFRPVEHRLELVRRVAGVDYYNDSKATNVDAARKALEAFDGNLWVILGGKDKDGDFAGLRALLADKARGVLLVGDAARKIAAQVGGAVPLLEAGTLERAVRWAAERAAPGDTVLLAPACASFDQFENYEHRGRVFKQLVEALESPRGATP